METGKNASDGQGERPAMVVVVEAGMNGCGSERASLGQLIELTFSWIKR